LQDINTRNANFQSIEILFTAQADACAIYESKKGLSTSPRLQRGLIKEQHHFNHAPSKKSEFPPPLLVFNKPCGLGAPTT